MRVLRPIGIGAAGLLAAAVMAATGWGITHARTDPGMQLQGQMAPALAVRDLVSGDVSNLAQLHGRPVVLNFWASWCVPCRQEAAIFNDAASRHQGAVAFVGADFRDSDRAARAFATEFKTDYPSGPIVQGSYQAYFVTAPPETFFIDRTGVVALRIVGPILDSGRMDLYLSQIGVR